MACAVVPDPCRWLTAGEAVSLSIRHSNVLARLVKKATQSRKRTSPGTFNPPIISQYYYLLFSKPPPNNTSTQPNQHVEPRPLRRRPHRRRRGLLLLPSRRRPQGRSEAYGRYINSYLTIEKERALILPSRRRQSRARLQGRRRFQRHRIQERSRRRCCRRRPRA